jgi:hypothetical protein
MDAFVKGLQNPGGRQQPYNSANPDYAAELTGLYDSVLRYKEACGVK